MGINCEKTKQHAKAIKVFEKYLKASEQSEDTQGIALGYNHLGLNCFYLGSNEALQLSLQYFSKHAELSRETGRVNLERIHLILAELPNWATQPISNEFFQGLLCYS